MTTLAKSRARELLRTYCISNPDGLRNLEEIANAEGLIVEDVPLDNCQGKIRYEGSYGLIKVSSAIRERGTRRFVIAHEMGHFFNEKSKLIRCTSQDMLPVKSHPQGDAPLAQKKVSEDDANAFAVEPAYEERMVRGLR